MEEEGAEGVCEDMMGGIMKFRIDISNAQLARRMGLWRMMRGGILVMGMGIGWKGGTD